MENRREILIVHGGNTCQLPRTKVILEQMIKITLCALVILIAGVAACVPTATPTLYPATPLANHTSTGKQHWELEWENTLEAARQEKELVMYTTAGPEIRIGFTNAMKKYGLQMEFVTGKGVELNNKLLAERRAGLFIGDTYMGGSTSVIAQLLPEGVMDPLKPELIISEVMDTKYWYGGKLPFVDKEERLFGFRGSVFWPFTINTTLVKPEEMVSYKDLLNPKFKGKIAMNDPTIEGAIGTFLTMVGEYFTGYDFIRELARQEPFISRDERLLTEWVARGKYSILIGTKPDPIAEFQKVGAPLLVIIPKEGSIIEPGAGTISVINRRPHSNAARIFVNWLLTKEGQTLYAEAAGIESAREDVSKAHLDAKLVREQGKTYVFGDEELHKIKEKNLKLWANIFGPLMK